MIKPAPAAGAQALHTARSGPARRPRRCRRPDVAALRTRDAGRRDIRQHEDLLVGELIGHQREVRPRIRYEQVLRPGAVDGVAEPPATERAVTLRMRAVQAVEALSARGDRADDHPLTGRVLPSRPSPSSSMTPTGSWPRISPGRTGYSPLTMWTSVPQIVVAVMRMTASPAFGRGLWHLLDADVVDAVEDHRFHRVHNASFSQGPRG